MVIRSKPLPPTMERSFTATKRLKRKTQLTFYFATPYHSWERGTNENTNGLVRQYLPKRMSMAFLSQAQCNAIARRLNERPRKRHAYATPLDMLHQIKPRGASS